MIHQLEPQLSFDESLHRYYLDGAPVPNVTRILQAAGLLRYDFLSDQHREQCLARGHAVHQATQRDDQGGLAEDSISADVLNYLEAWRGFRRDFGFAPDLIEHTVYHPQLHYCGRLDRVGRIRDGTEIIADLKTGIAPPSARFQLAAYCACLPHARTRLRRCVELHADGTYKVIPYETRDYQRDFDTFASALRAYRAQEEI